MIPIARWAPSEGLVLEPNALEAAKETARNLALTAGPGAGKTEMLAQRADFLLRTATCRYPRRILAISFKVDAAQNLRARVRRRCGPDLAARLDSYTFHAFAKRLIDQFRPALKGANALDPDYSIGQRRVQRTSITFADMVPLAQMIIENSRIARNAVRQTYSHVFLDEFQDCTADQYALITACFGGSKCLLTAVGDTKQSIMGWAGALEGIFQTFADDFAAHPLNLYQNFRSAPTLRRIQNAMVRVMDPPAALDDADIVGDEGAIAILNFADDEEEADGIAARVQQLADNDGVSLSEIAILVSKQQQLYCQKLIAAFDAHGIAYREEDSTQNLASEPAARLIVDFLLVTSSPRQPGAHRRLLDLVVFNQGVDEEREYQLRSKWNRLLGETRKAIATGKINLAHKPDLEKLVETLLDAVGSEDIVAMSSAYAQGDMLATCIVETVDRAHELLSGGADPATALSSFSGDRAVRIMSIHKSKGLEFDTVFLLGVEEETFWGKQADERSAFFVGISRAKLRLFLTVCERRCRPTGARRWTVPRRPHEEFLSYV